MRSKRGVEGGDQEQLRVLEGFALGRSRLGGHNGRRHLGVVPIGGEDQDQGCLLDKGLVATQLGQLGLAVRVLDGNDTPGLEVGRRGGDLGGSHQHVKSVVGQGLARDKVADGLVGQNCGEGVDGTAVEDVWPLVPFVLVPLVPSVPLAVLEAPP